MSAFANDDNDTLSYGIYEALLDEGLRDALLRHPELRSVLSKVDPEEQPSRYAAFVAKVIEKSLLQETDSLERLNLCNRLIDLLAGTNEKAHLEQHRLVFAEKSVLSEITPPYYAQQGIPRPATPIVESSLFTGSPHEPQLVQNLQAEMRSADTVDILISFIKWSGLRLLMPAFEDLATRNVPVRVITTSYMGASDSPAVEWLAKMPNIEVRVSFDTDRTRLHAKAYHFQRNSGFSTAYIGSANMSHAAMTSGLEWNLKVTAQDMSHIIEKFSAEFETYWNSHNFLPFNPDNFSTLREAIQHARTKTPIPAAFFDLRPHPFQERILDALEAERTVHNQWKNLVIAATGTGKTVVADFGNRYAAEIRLPEALEEKLLCPFHYFGVADPVALTADTFWKNGKYDIHELENVYTGAHALALQRLDAIRAALLRYEPDLSRVKGIGFCVSIHHAEYMASMFNERGITSAVLIGETRDDKRTSLLKEFRDGKLTFLFTRDVLNEGLDVPDVNTVLFLRPTESLTVFLQQLGRGLRHAPDKDCLTVLDFVGQAHRRYRIDSKLKALLPKTRYAIDREIELDFPHLPAGCSIHLDRIARDYVLTNIRENLRNLSVQIPERLQTFENEASQPLTFANFVRYHDYEPETLLVRETWSEWKAMAHLIEPPRDPDISSLRSALVRAASITGPMEIKKLRKTMDRLRLHDIQGALDEAGDFALSIHYRFWGKSGAALGVTTLKDSFSKLAGNTSILSDIGEVLEWAEEETRIGGTIPELPFPCSLELHAQYSNSDIKAALGMATLESAGTTGVGVLHFRDIKAYAALITFQKTEREFSPSTMYADYPVSRELLHWESQSNTTQNSDTGQNLIHHMERGYTILIFVRAAKKRNGITTPFTYLGPADRVSYESERPIKIIWRLRYPMPAEIFEENRRGG